eukprot:TRINITY_DN15009_c0_g1_i3.p1 TRINITY_DN15009_c0_g1~~TRINITY_DN15009_c0_g1_i3.p1  ORF type:complete len:240 (-),score=31.02 TRINITY_DN15009_c0_g1_i3:272-991(-)
MLQLLCTKAPFFGSCSKHSTGRESQASPSSASSKQPRPYAAANPQEAGSIFEHFNLKPTIVDLGEIQFPSSTQARKAWNRASSAGARQRGQMNYVSADFVELPKSHGADGTDEALFSPDVGEETGPNAQLSRMKTRSPMKTSVADRKVGASPRRSGKSSGGAGSADTASRSVEALAVNAPRGIAAKHKDLWLGSPCFAQLLPESVSSASSLPVEDLIGCCGRERNASHAYPGDELHEHL